MAGRAEYTPEERLGTPEATFRAPVQAGVGPVLAPGVPAPPSEAD